MKIMFPLVTFYKSIDHASRHLIVWVVLSINTL